MFCYGVKLQSPSGENSIVYSLYLRLYGSLWTYNEELLFHLCCWLSNSRRGKCRQWNSVSCCNSVIELPLLFSPWGTNVSYSFVCLYLWWVLQDCFTFTWDNFICLCGTAHCVNCSLCLGIQHWGKGFLWFVVRLWNYVDISQWLNELPLSLYDQSNRFISWCVYN